MKRVLWLLISLLTPALASAADEFRCSTVCLIHAADTNMVFTQNVLTTDASLEGAFSKALFACYRAKQTFPEPNVRAKLVSPFDEGTDLIRLFKGPMEARPESDCRRIKPIK